MFTVKEITREAGVSARTLHHYDAIGLLKPTRVSAAGYRLYDADALHRLRLILLLRELQFSLSEIQKLLELPDRERNTLLEQQIQKLEDKRSQLDRRITFARGLQMMGVKNMNLEHYQNGQLDEQIEQAKALWGKTEAWAEYEEKQKQRTPQQDAALENQMMALFTEAGTLRQLPPESPEAQHWAAQLQGYITDHFYTCTPQILLGLGRMYAGGGSFTENIDRVGGEGTAEFAHRAIEAYCANL